jgi:hypothetical protein
MGRAGRPSISVIVPTRNRAILLEASLNSLAFGCEDIELAYRLTRFNLQVVHDREAVQSGIVR